MWVDRGSPDSHHLTSVGWCYEGIRVSSHVTRIRQPKSEYSREAKWQGEAPPGRAWLLVTTAERSSRYIPGFWFVAEC
jgi:hypothetical protein